MEILPFGLTGEPLSPSKSVPSIEIRTASIKSAYALLKKYVDDQGMVDYTGLKKDRLSLRRYLSGLENNAPNDDWTKDEKLAYWINAYNAYTLDLIIQHYPVQSIKEIGSTIKIPFVSTAWDVKFIEIGGEKYDLNN